MTSARSVRVRGMVQGVGFRPFVARLARTYALAGWVQNAAEGVELLIEGDEAPLDEFLRDLGAQAPRAAAIAGIDVAPRQPSGLHDFVIIDSSLVGRPTTRISPDLCVCDRCLAELFDDRDPRYHYPYINCTDCGPRYSIILALPYDRANTTMRGWEMDRVCDQAYDDPADRRYHAQPLACPECGPRYRLVRAARDPRPDTLEPISAAAALLRAGQILAIKGIGGYHLACDARNDNAVRALRERKFRKEKPFALMARDLTVARTLVELSAEDEELLTSSARPIVLARGLLELEGIAPDNTELGVMLPYAPLHHLLFADGAPTALVLTSANRSNEPIAYEDPDAFERLGGIVDAWLVGERPIARRVEDSVARTGPLGAMILRRGRGYAPGAVATVPTDRPILALGADLKSAITLTVDGQAFVSQHIGDLEHYQARQAFHQTIDDLLAMYRVDRSDLTVVRDPHPGYWSSRFAAELGDVHTIEVQHHRAHVASVLAERGAWDSRVVALSADGTGYGDDGSIWGGELFVGSLVDGFERVGHLRQAVLVGGDAAARSPIQAAAGFLHQIDGLPNVVGLPFRFPARFDDALRLLDRGIRTFRTSSIGRLFDAAAALLGFTRPVTFEGQAAIWLEHLARLAPTVAPYRFPFEEGELDFRPLLAKVARDRLRGRDRGEIARAFHGGVAKGFADAAIALGLEHGLRTLVLSGGVFQNMLLLGDLAGRVQVHGFEVWTNQLVPPNDGGLSLGQAALAAVTISTAMA